MIVVWPRGKDWTSDTEQEGFALNCTAHHSTKVSFLQSTISSCQSGLDLPNGDMQPKGETLAKLSMPDVKNGEGPKDDFRDVESS